MVLNVCVCRPSLRRKREEGGEKGPLCLRRLPHGGGRPPSRARPLARSRESTDRTRQRVCPPCPADRDKKPKERNRRSTVRPFVLPSVRDRIGRFPPPLHPPTPLRSGDRPVGLPLDPSSDFETSQGTPDARLTPDVRPIRPRASLSTLQSCLG